MRRPVSLAAVASVYVMVVGGAMLVGALVYQTTGQALRLTPGARTGGEPLELLRAVLLGNGRLWAHICLGVFTFGVTGLVAVAGNALRFGMDVAALALHAPRELQFLLPHAALEFTAFWLAASACQFLGLRLLDVLGSTGVTQPQGVRAALWALGWSAVLLATAAVVETVAFVARGG